MQNKEGSVTISIERYNQLLEGEKELKTNENYLKINTDPYFGESYLVFRKSEVNDSFKKIIIDQKGKIKELEKEIAKLKISEGKLWYYIVFIKNLEGKWWFKLFLTGWLKEDKKYIDKKIK
jgi:hypothetical protein